MKTFCLTLFLIGSTINVLGQHSPYNEPIFNYRLSFLIAPFTPLLTVEVVLINDLTLQLETNFNDIHGANLKYYLKERMSKDYVFIGSGFLQDEYLRSDSKTTILPYLGYGYAYRFGKSKKWTFDSRLGIGATVNADKNVAFPVFKTGIGRTF